MLKLAIFCVFGFFIFIVTAIEYPVETSSGNYVVSEKTRTSGIAAMKRFFEVTTKEHNLTCENYLDYCSNQDKSFHYETSFFRVLCEIGIKSYLCDNSKDGEALAQLYDKVSAYIYDTARGHGPFGPPATTTQPPPTKSPFDYD